ncbi:hypothetical protein [uncultured Tenacibaculum sp.]|uniref:hypothetical protein n=1 Tax=uncultured Tenacibaculum sp. TaxID=174713 RepID=UPI0026257344|nr:hypothetical protein [uncultured Tenacibaculum sp.]
MKLISFYENLRKIDFNEGRNTQTLEDYLLACLTLLDLYKEEKPSYELFLLIYDQARNGLKVDFNLFWEDYYKPPIEKNIKPKFYNLSYWKNILSKIRNLNFEIINKKELNNEYVIKLTDWESLRNQLCYLAVDLINTKNIRGKNSPKNEENEWGEWFTEAGEKFYNGNTPENILTYATRRYIEDISLKYYEKDKITWKCFSDPIWIGIKYE